MNYLIIQCGYEGIEKLVHLTDDADAAVKKINKLRAAKQYKRDTWKNVNPDSYCVQKWDGKEFKCCCKELGVSPSKPWMM